MVVPKPQAALTRTGPIVFMALLVIGVFAVTCPADPRGRPRRISDFLRNGPGLINHPVNIVPSSSITIPRAWPLGDDGSITCLTCHEFLPTSTGATASSLRVSDDFSAGQTGFCGQCHSNDRRQSAAGMHWQAMDVAHVQPKQEKRASGRDLLDEASRRCLGCHDGLTATDASYSTQWDRGRARMGGMQADHPVGIRYPRFSSGMSDSQLRPIASLPDQIRLPGGRVACVSCHNLYAGKERLLAIENDRSMLCFSCHEME